jgi:uncharacterized NAD-dependent epimerase/dehydratase family protein
MNDLSTIPLAQTVLPQPYLLFLGDTTERGYAKTAFGLRDWAGDKCVGELACEGASVTTGLPALTPQEAVAAGARAMLIGVANGGGIIPDSWMPALIAALEAGLDLIGGMHMRLAEIPALAEAARRHGRRLHDVRTPPPSIPVGNGRKRSGKRLLTVGTDCALGKKYTALALASAFVARGVDAEFRATGQTGIMIAGAGVPLDSVVCDFTAGAAEALSPDAAPDHWDVIEGQGSLMHPAYAGVSLGLLHGSQPDVIVVCHEPGRSQVLGAPGYALPSIDETIEINLLLGRRTNPAIRCGGIAYNSSAMDEAQALEMMARDSERFGLPVADPIRGGPLFDKLVANCLS